MTEDIKRVTGLLIIEVVNSNPNGNPDQENDPRVRSNNGRGEISPVSFKRKLRDLMELTDMPVFQQVTKEITNLPDGYQFGILESRGRDRKIISKEMGDIKQYNEAQYLQSEFVKKYWDARLFGNTFLEPNRDAEYIKTGVAHFGMGLSVSQIMIQHHTLTNKAGVQEGKNQGMAPLAYRIVQHGVYAMPFFINPSLAHKSGCKNCDVEIFKNLIPYAYDHTRSALRPDVRIRHAWWMEHKNALGSCADYMLIDALTPKRKGDDPMAPSESWADYDVPDKLVDRLKEKIDSCEDLIN